MPGALNGERQALRALRLKALLFSLLWAAAWAFTIVLTPTQVFEPVPKEIFFAHVLALPFLIGVLAGSWAAGFNTYMVQRGGEDSPTQAAMAAALLAGGAFAVINSSLLVAWASALPRVAGGAEEAVGRGLGMALVVLSAGICVLVSLVGGLFGCGIGRWSSTPIARP
jgi:hypothetical protein